MERYQHLRPLHETVSDRPEDLAVQVRHTDPNVWEHVRIEVERIGR